MWNFEYEVAECENIVKCVSQDILSLPSMKCYLAPYSALQPAPYSAPYLKI